MKKYSKSSETQPPQIFEKKEIPPLLLLFLPPPLRIGIKFNPPFPDPPGRRGITSPFPLEKERDSFYHRICKEDPPFFFFKRNPP